jgi:dTDP-4-amino-4,6-dideoxygalactose transaminase
MRPIKPFTFDITVEEIEEFTREAAKILGTGILILGEHISRFEQAFAEFIGVQHAVAVNSGTSALEILLLPPPWRWCKRQWNSRGDRLRRLSLACSGCISAGSFRPNFQPLWSTAGAFSFFSTKVMTTCEDGMITTNSDEEDYLARSFRNQGKWGMNYGSLHHDHDAAGSRVRLDCSGQMPVVNLQAHVWV